jgi:hypothetical protein
LAYVAAFHAADAEPVGASAWQTLLARPDDLTTTRFRFQPSLQVLRSEYAIVSLWAAHQADADRALDSIDPDAPENAWVIRRDWRVGILNMPDSDTDFLAALQSGQSFGTAADAQNKHPDFDLSRCLSVFVAEQLVVGVLPD